MKTKQFLLWTIVLVMALPISASTYYVRSTGVDTNAGTSVGNPLLTVSTALAKATTNGDVIDIAGSVNFFGAVVVKVTINNNITIQGDNKSTAIISGISPGTLTPMQIGSSVLLAPTVKIQNLTFQNFDSFGTGNYINGGVIFLNSGTLNCSNVNFLNNTAYSGGAIYVSYIANDAAVSAVNISDCYFFNNQAKKITTNIYADGGAISIVLGGTNNNKINVDLERCLFEANTAEDSGSALRSRFQSTGTGESTLLVQNCTFANNINKNGGLNTGSQVTGKGVIFTEGNGVSQSGVMKFINNTIAYNSTQATATGSVAGFHNQSCLGMITMINNIIFSNTNAATPSASVSVSSYKNLLESRNNISDSWVALSTTDDVNKYSGNVKGVASVSLKLAAALADNGGTVKTLTLATGSVAINAGYLIGVPTIDQRNYGRVGSVDIGAYEYSGTNIAGAATASAFTTTYGTSSSAQLFSIAGTNLTADLIATAPTGFEVSSGGAYGSTATFAQTSGSTSGILSLRLAANAAVSGSYNSQNIVLSSTGVTSVNIVTAASGNVVSAIIPNLEFITPTSVSKNFGDRSFINAATSSNSGGTITYSSGTPSVATIDASTGLVSILKTGSTVITASITANGNFTSTTAIYTLNINSPATVSILSDANLSSYYPSSETDVTVNSGILTIDADETVKSMIIKPGAKLTIVSGKILTIMNALTLQSDAVGTATLVDNGGTINAATTNVQQHLSSIRNWYMSSPLTNATTQIGYTYFQYDEQGNNPHSPITLPETAYWESVASGTTLEKGRGYIVLPASVATPVSFSTTGGSLNTGDVDVNLTYSGATKKGFNLIGNPYPCHLGWTYDFANANSSLIESSIWIRTNSGTTNSSGQWSFTTFNATSSESVPSVDNAGIIPPMQAFWVRAKAAGKLTLNSLLTKSHQSSNPFKVPAAKNSDRQRLRLEVSNGTSTDETLVYFDAAAGNGYDTYDSPKFADANAAVQIYTIAGTENLVINGLNSIPEAELPLGFTTTSAGTYSLKVSQFSNLDAGTKVILKDYTDMNNPVISDLSDGSTYTFFSGVANSNTTRFSLIFKVPSSSTGVNPGSIDNVWVSTNTNGQIIINGVANGKTSILVFNEIGQRVVAQQLTSTVNVVGSRLVPGVYFVTLNVAGNKITKKVIIN